MIAITDKEDLVSSLEGEKVDLEGLDLRLYEARWLEAVTWAREFMERYERKVNGRKDFKD